MGSAVFSSSPAASPRKHTAKSTFETAPVYISLIVPVYNSMPYLLDLLESIDAQDLNVDQFEVIFVNDGSTDTSAQVLVDYAREHSFVTVIHQENSGWAGKPRNVGLERARGKYVYFVDADDWLGPQALSRMKAFALEHNPDVVAPRLVPVGDRRAGGRLFARTVVDAPLEQMIQTLMPQKMIRTTLLIEKNIRFSEEKVRLEDGMALVQAYCAAQRNSILGDYDYYFIRARDDGGNISYQPIEPIGYTKSLAHIAQTLRDNVLDTQRSQDLIAALFSRKGLKIYKGQRFLKYRASRQLGWIKAHQEFLHEFLPHDLHRFTGVQRDKIQCILNSDHDRLLKLAAMDVEESRPLSLRNVKRRMLGLDLVIAAPRFVSEIIGLAVADRKSGHSKEYALVPLPNVQGEGRLYRCSLPVANLRGRLDLSLLLNDGRSRRIEYALETDELLTHGIRVYRTRNGFASIDAQDSNFDFAQKFLRSTNMLVDGLRRRAKRIARRLK